jgi:Domain of unknown function (DUF222)
MLQTPMHESDINALADRIAETAAQLDAGTHRLLTDLRQFDQQGGWASQGAVSCAHWLNWRCGIALGAAREKVRVAHALGGLPLIDDALRLGQISFSKARAMTRIATQENEAQLVELARHSTAAQLERVCRLYGRTQPRDPADPARRYFRVRDTEDSMVRIEIQLCPDEAARLLKACDVSAETRLDGLVTMAEATLHSDQPDRPPVEILVQIDACTLVGQEEQTGISAETSLRLLCDAGIVPVLTDAQGTPLDVGRKSRSIPAALRRALAVRDRGCRFPGCTHTRYVDAHHVRHWVAGGETSLANTLLLCGRHHTLVHEGGFRVVVEGTRPRFFDPVGVELREAGIPPVVGTRTYEIGAPSPGWDGQRVDYDAAVGSLL